MKKIRGKTKPKKKTATARQRVQRANTSYAALDDRVTQLEARVHDLAVGLAGSQTPAPAELQPVTTVEARPRDGGLA